MARTVPVHTGYTIVNGTGTGPNGNRIDVWVEYLLGQADVAGNCTPITAYFYAALNPNYSSTTAYSTGLNASFTVDTVAGSAVSRGAYDFTSPAKVNLLGSFSGNIAHDSQGNKTLTFEGRFTTQSSYITGGTIRASVTLPPIAQVPAIAAEPATLGEKCCVSWTPTAADHSFTLQFSLGQWNLTTERIATGSTEKLTYTDTVLPLEVARQFPEKTGTMLLTLTAYQAEKVLGTSTASFTVTVPENQQTCPTVTAVLTPECELFPGLYVQRLGKVRAAAEAQDPLGAQIKAVRLQVGNTTWEDTVSGFLEQSGTLPVTVTAESSRGFTGTWKSEIRVYSYNSPRLLRADAYRCLSDGTADPGGTFLALKAEHSFSSLDGANTCTLRWRYKQENGSYGPWQEITPIVQGVVLEKNMAYAVQIRTADSAGSTEVRTFAIAPEQVYMHRTKNALGLGGYAEGSDILDLYWKVRARKGVSGAYIAAAQDDFTLRFTSESENQGAFLIGCGVCGVVQLSAGEATWEGTEGVSVTAGEEGIAVTLPQVHGQVLILSPDPMEI